MTISYAEKDILLGEATGVGHVCYVDALYCPSDTDYTPTKIIYKKNKYQNAQFSRLEVAFNQLARLFLDPKSTPTQGLVKNEAGEITGLAVEHLCYVIEQKESLKPSFYQLTNPKVDCSYEETKPAQAEEIPLYFFDKLPPEFFADLLKEEQEKRLKIDYASLANIFTGPYSLEEDDLHKGNFGFYLVNKEEMNTRHRVPTVAFFKVDPDLMFAQSIMSFISVRTTHWTQTDHAFDITAEDLIDFPNIKNSSNAYWPTKKGFFPFHEVQRKFLSYREVNSFVGLASNEDFKKAKWSNFYKHILMPSELIKQSLEQCLDKDDPEERALIALLTQATIERQAKLRAVLFSIEEFRNFVSTLTVAEEANLLNGITPHARVSSRRVMKGRITKELKKHQELCRSPQGFVKGDSPLHVAIKLGDYRYEETAHMYGNFITHKNAANQSPIDILFDKIKVQDTNITDAREDSRYTLLHLIENGAELSPEQQQLFESMQLENYTFRSAYINAAGAAVDYKQLKEVLQSVGEEHRFCLKFQKTIAIACLVEFIEKQRHNPQLATILEQLKQEVNGYSSVEDAAGLKYIRQLRSKLWIIRQIRGLYGNSSTLGEINELVDSKLAQLSASNSVSCFSFFAADISPPPEYYPRDLDEWPSTQI